VRFLGGHLRAPRWLTAQRVALASLLVDACLLLAKLTIAVLTGSLGMLSEAVHTGLDLVRRSGGRMLGDAEVSARPTLSVEGAQRLREEVLAAVGHRHPDLDLSVVVEPQSEESNLVERVHKVAAGLEMIRDLHNVTVERERDGKLHISMHVKLPGGMALQEAAVASADLERRLRQEVPDVSRVDVHLEPLEPEEIAGADVTRVRPDLAREICRIVESHPEVRACRDVELSERSGEWWRTWSRSSPAR
jgi:divalent metal cation (Fe/Co/Zn/Cd) transporter